MYWEYMKWEGSGMTGFGHRHLFRCPELCYRCPDFCWEPQVWSTSNIKQCWFTVWQREFVWICCWVFLILVLAAFSLCGFEDAFFNLRLPTSIHSIQSFAGMTILAPLFSSQTLSPKPVFKQEQKTCLAFGWCCASLKPRGGVEWYW